MRKQLVLMAVIAGMATAVVAAQQSQGPATTERVLPLWQITDTPAARDGAARDGQPGLAVTVRFDLLQEAAAAGGVMELPLNRDLSVRAGIRWAESSGSETFIAGPLVGNSEGEASLTIVEDRLVGRIVANGRLFMVRRAADSLLHMVTEIDQTSLPPEAAPLTPEIVSGDTFATPVPQGAELDTNQFVDLLIVYTSEARAAAGGTSAIVAELTGAVNNANLALANAGVTHRYWLAHYEEVVYAHVDHQTDLSRLRAKTDGFLDGVHALRDQYHADVVTMLGTSSDACGIGYLMSPGSTSASFEGFAFNVVNWTCANGNLTLAHEIGHNMGLQHDRPNAGSTPAYPYGYGYAISGFARDVMAYECVVTCPRRAIYSTPLFNFPGTATSAGTPTEDGARALNDASSIVANFRQTAAPSITSQPASQTIASGSTSTMSVTATGTALTYQWYVGSSGLTGSPIGGATSSSYTTPPLASTTSYWVRVSNGAGMANSNTATVTVVTPPAMTTHPASQTIASGSTATMSVTATGSAPLIYQWYVGTSGSTGSPIGGATSSSYTTPPLASTTSYWVRVSNWAGSANSNTATVTVVTPPAMTTHPVSQTVRPGQAVMFSVTASGTAPSFQWQVSTNGGGSWTNLSNGAPYSGVTTATLTVSGVALSLHRLQYRSVASNFAGSATSHAAILTVLRNPLSDFDGDGKADVILRNKSTGQNIGWLTNGLTVSTSAWLPTIADTNWEIVGTGDFDGDGKADVILRNAVTGQDIGWLMNGLTVTSSAFMPTIADTNWEIRGIGDFDGDGKSDVILRHKSTGQDIGWLMNGLTVTSAAFMPTIADVNWEIVVVGDLDGDGKADVVLRNKSTGQNIGWLMNGLTVANAAFLPTIADTNWEIKGMGDMDGDGKADVILRHKGTGQNIGWLMNGLTVINSAFMPTIADVNWEIKGMGDMDGDGKADVLLRNRSTGQNIGWLMNGLSVSTSAFMPTIADTNWEFVGQGQ